MLTFEAHDIHSLLDEAPPEVLDAAPFGIIRLDASYRVVHYNVRESRLSGLDPARVKGRSFFEDVAPCTNNTRIAQRMIDEPTLDVIIEYVFAFRMRPTPVLLRLLQSPNRSFRYLLVRIR